MDEKMVEELLRLEAELFPDEVDWFEDELAHRLGIDRGLGIDLVQWRKIRVRAIEATGSRADAVAAQVENLAVAWSENSF